VLDEAEELLDAGLLSDADLRALTFANPVALWGTTNPRFFEGTVVEEEARSLLLA
jgi:hypothetical protein